MENIKMTQSEFDSEFKRANDIIDKTNEMLNNIKESKKYKPMLNNYNMFKKKYDEINNFDEIINKLLSTKSIKYRDN